MYNQPPLWQGSGGTKHLKVIFSIACFWLALCGLSHAGKGTYVYTDPQGTPLAEADEQGNIIATYDYTPYGTQVMGTAPNGPGYTGHVNDPDTGLVYMQARYYDTITGRFLSIDPASPKAGNVFTFGRYNYANNNPLRFTDPDGRQSYENMSLTGMAADELLEEGKITPEQHLQMWADGSRAGAKGLFLG